VEYTGSTEEASKIRSANNIAERNVVLRVRTCPPKPTLLLVSLLNEDSLISNYINPPIH